MKTRDFQKMKKIIKKFKKKRVLVLGDLMHDKYIWGSVIRISPEAPVPVVEAYQETSCLGGAGNVCQSLKSLGAYPLLVGIVGNDSEGEWIKRNVPDSRGIFVDESRPTTLKTRIIAHHQHVVRVDKERKGALTRRIEEQIINFVQGEKYDGLILSDYNKGVMTKFLTSKVLSFAQKRKIPVFVDPKVENFFLFTPVTLITPNHFEAARIVHHDCDTNSQIESAGNEILSRIVTPFLIIKRGEQGMSVFERGKKAIHIPTVAKEVFDITGAGDTVIATAALALLSGSSILEAAALANTAAGIVVGKIGTASVTAEELLASLKS